MKRKRKLKRRRQAMARQWLQNKEPQVAKKVYGESPLAAGLALTAAVRRLAEELKIAN